MKTFRYVLAALVMTATISPLGRSLRATEDGETGPERRLIWVEEDWVLFVLKPDSLKDSPQISTQMLPYRSQSNTFGQFHLNFRETSPPQGGGLEVQLWLDGQRAGEQRIDAGRLSTDNETIRWTQGIGVRNGAFLFRVRNGTSTSFGRFGGWRSRLRAWAPAQTEEWASLDYDPADSVKHSGITLGKNRVHALKLMEVRRFYSDGTIDTDANPKVVHEQPLDDTP
jgi:hypothetical protein